MFHTARCPKGGRNPQGGFLSGTNNCASIARLWHGQAGGFQGGVVLKTVSGYYIIQLFIRCIQYE